MDRVRRHREVGPIVAEVERLRAENEALTALNARLKLADFNTKADRSVVLRGLAKLNFGYARELAARIEATKCKTCRGDGFSRYVGGDDDDDECPACEGSGFI